ncbi:hypothetical protein ElyMa_004916600 [Elysia marginata]|uniref:Transmembrane protein n=1 Tax=Elysia marginata TaxID=1093978 RepID=A0AAV4J050_9GAST|nr:hypothetical protein ElyMa_004916600 [Elysia marginata]
MPVGKAEMASAADTQAVEGGGHGTGDLDCLDSQDETGSSSKAGTRRADDRGGGVTMGVVNLSGGAACGAEHEVVGGENVCCGEGRVWIFLVLGLIMLVFCGAIVGVYMTVRTLTTSLHEVEVMPTYVPVTAVSGAVLCFGCRNVFGLWPERERRLWVSTNRLENKFKINRHRQKGGDGKGDRK